MELWIDPATNQIKAWYTHPYTGTVWPDAGYVKVITDGLPDGADIDAQVAGPADLRVVAPPPPPVPDPVIARIAELQAKVKDDTATVKDLRELYRLERGL